MAELRDLAGRRIHYLRVAVTDKCNFCCQYCMPQQGVEWIPPEQLLSDEELLTVIRVFARLGIDKVRITGGEPLVREGIIDFLRQAAGIPGIKEVNITTNGSLLGQYAPALKAAGVKRINVSLDTLRRERFIKLAGQDALNSVLAGIDKAETVGFTAIKINMVVMKDVNSDELADFARMTMNKPYQIRFIEHMPFQADQEYFLSADEMIKQLKAEGFPELIAVPGELSTARIYRLPGAKGTIGFISPVSQHFCTSCNRIRITPDGYLKPCLLSNKEYLLRDRLRAGVSEHQLMEDIERIVRQKPPGHRLDKGCISARPMSRIGG